MPRPRHLVLSGKATDTILISCRLHDDSPTLGWEERAVLQTFIRELHEPGVAEIPTWCILPRAYRFIVRTHANPELTEPSALTTMGAKMKILQSRFRRWRQFQGISTPLWQDRFKSSPLPDPGHILAAGASIDGLPVVLGLVDRPEDYYFSGFHHACQGDAEARKGIALILGGSPSSWSGTRRSYSSTLRKLSLH